MWTPVRLSLLSLCLVVQLSAGQKRQPETVILETVHNGGDMVFPERRARDLINRWLDRIEVKGLGEGCEELIPGPEEKEGESCKCLTFE